MTGFLLAAAMTVQVGSIAALPLPPKTVSASYQGGEALILANHAVIGIEADADAEEQAFAVYSRLTSR